MCDFFGPADAIENISIDTTPYIDFQINKYNEGEYLLEKHIPEQVLFTSPETISSLKSFYSNNVDIPILAYGGHGIGKITCILGLIVHIPCYLPDYPIYKKVNNMEHFKILDSEFNKVLSYENIFYLNINILHNDTEIISYLTYMYRIATSRSIDENEKKIIIISHIDKCNHDAQRYITFMLDKISINVSYIFTTYTINIDKKIVSSCAPLKFKYLNETEFSNIFKVNFSKSFAKKDLHQNYVKRYYDIYIENHYNIGNTISQIKYNLAVYGNSFLKDSDKTCSLMSKIVSNFINKKMILSTVNSALEIRKFLYTLVSLNIELKIFVHELVNQLLKHKLHNNIKNIITEKANILLSEIKSSNKEIVVIETFIYDIITKIFSIV